MSVPSAFLFFCVKAVRRREAAQGKSRFVGHSEHWCCNQRRLSIRFAKEGRRRGSLRFNCNRHLLHAPTRKNVGYFGAVRLRDGKLLTKREEKVFDAETFWRFLKLLRQVSSLSGRRVAVISDNAKYHHALLHREWRQQLARRFALHFLPPYTPQLNPIERIWKLKHPLCLHNVFFAHLQEVTDRVEEQFEQWKNPNDTLRKLCNLA